MRDVDGVAAQFNVVRETMENLNYYALYHSRDIKSVMTSIALNHDIW
jgi:hypothetical protein